MVLTSADWQNHLTDASAFMTHVVDEMDGWLDRYAAKRTIDLLTWQEEHEVAGSVYEVGVYYGKYFSILIRSAALTGSRAVGIDSFEYISVVKFNSYFADKVTPQILCELTRLQWGILERPSSEISARELIESLGGAARFISIDGSHEYDDVLWDLRVADEVLAAGGIISADDFLNPISLGVTAAIYKFLDITPTLVPFAHVSNKLFLCRPGWADRYRAAVTKAILAEQGEPKSEDFRASYGLGATRNIEATFRGYRILTIRL